MPAPRETAHDLLFGLIALQNGFLDPSRLILAFQAWRLDKSRPMAELLVEQGAIDVSQRAVLEALAAKILEIHGGDPEKGLSSLRPSRSTREELAAAAAADPDLDATLSFVAVAETGTDDGSSVTRFESIGASTSGGLRFQVLRPHARGGLGAVFVALDDELHREVALKQILESHADDPTSRQRFVIEAEITGGLEHPGIVPVYGLGAYSDGRPYYAMRFIKGDSLKDAITRFHDPAIPKVGKAPADPTGLELRRLLRRLLDVCNAIHYAHARGVLHRDIKPANIIVGNYGETLVVDWGLAKARGLAEPGSAERPLALSSGSGGAAETLPGSALGTPAYMSPEQARGALDQLDARADVYSLGASLYHLLTGQPPFAGGSGVGVAEILQGVQRGDFRRPRQVDPTIDPALEAVCLKAMALAPDDRYPTAKALADDLDRWAADEPVTAWREPWTRRARRWMKRHRTVVSTAAAAVAMSVVGLAAVLAVQSRANAALALKNDELAIANAQVNQANLDLRAASVREKRRFALALDSIETFTDTVRNDDVLKNPSLSDLRTRLLTQPRTFYQRLEDVLKDQPDADSRKALGDAYFGLGRLNDEIGSKPEALASQERARAIRQRLADEDRDGPASASSLATSHHTIGLLLHDTGKPDEALAAIEKARAIQERLAANHPTVPSYQSDLAQSQNDLGRILNATGKPDEAVATIEKALAIRERLAAANPAETRYRADLGASHHNIGFLLSARGRPIEALAAYERARVIQQRLVDENPTVTAFQRSLAATANNSGLLLSETGKSDQAMAAYQSARAIRQRLADENPAVTQFQTDLALSHNIIGLLMVRTGKPAEGLASYENARAIRERLAAANPSVIQLQSDLGASHNNIASQLYLAGKLDEAMASYEKGRRIRQRLADENPTTIQFQNDLAMSHFNIALVLGAMGKTPQSLESSSKARAIWERLTAANPTLAPYQSYLASCLGSMALALATTGKPDEARATHEQERAIWDRLATANPAVTFYQRGLASSLLNLGNLLQNNREFADALVYYEQALATRRRLAVANPTVTDLRHDLAIILYNLAVVESELDRSESARGRYTEAAEVLRALTRTNPQNPAYRQARHLTLRGLAKTALGLRQPDQAAAATVARELAESDATNGEVLYDSACLLARCGALAPDQTQAARFADEALALLTKAVDAGWTQPARAAVDPDLATLRDRDDFRKLLNRLFDASFPADPFAP